MLDFNDAGEIGLLVDDASVAARERAIGGRDVTLDLTGVANVDRAY